MGDGWPEWAESFARFLDRNDAPNCPWGAFLRTIEGLKGRPTTVQDEAAWEAELGISNIID